MRFICVCIRCCPLIPHWLSLSLLELSHLIDPSLQPTPVRPVATHDKDLGLGTHDKDLGLGVSFHHDVFFVFSTRVFRRWNEMEQSLRKCLCVHQNIDACYDNNSVNIVATHQESTTHPPIIRLCMTARNKVQDSFAFFPVFS